MRPSGPSCRRSGICRGMQLMAVRAGGALEQHLPDVGRPRGACAGRRARTAGPRSGPSTDSLVRRLVGDDLQVSCHHHQAVVRHPGFEVTARAADGTIEAMEDPDRPFWLGVQWHPESGDDHGLFIGLAEAAARPGHRVTAHFRSHQPVMVGVGAQPSLKLPCG